MGFTVCRAIIGCSLASFVACQVWCSQQFSKSIVGVANATSGGWGNLGGGITNLLMPYVFLGFMSATGNNENVAWRLCFIIPFVLHLLGAALAMSGRDLPDGNYAELEKQGSKQKSKADVVIKVGLSNINAWILTFTYGFCFGVELTMTNVAALYFYEFHAVAQSSAGVMASTFGLVNLFARSLGGICSDWANAKWGMRGRIWALWFWQMVEGALCMVMGFLTLHLTPPDFTGPANIEGWTAIGGWVKPTASGWVPISQGVTSWVPFTANATNPPTFIPRCGAMQIELTDDMRASLDPRYDGLNTVVLSEPPSPFGNGDDCVSNSGLIVPVVIVVFAFSLAVQMAEGLTYGIVPSVSRPALGVVSGMVGAGGNAGALVTNACFFLSDAVRTDTGFINMGVMIIIGTALLFGCCAQMPRVSTPRLQRPSPCLRRGPPVSLTQTCPRHYPDTPPLRSQTSLTWAACSSRPVGSTSTLRSSSRPRATRAPTRSSSTPTRRRRRRLARFRRPLRLARLSSELWISAFTGNAQRAASALAALAAMPPPPLAALA